jgi:hypothetical protein
VVAWHAAATDAGAGVNVRLAPYSAAGNGTTCGTGSDDTAAIQAAINAIPSGGSGEVYLPAGHYRITSTLTVTGRSVEFLGDGQRLSVLRFCTSNLLDGIVFAAANPGGMSGVHNTLAVRSLSVLRGNGQGGGAIVAKWPAVRFSLGGQMEAGNGGSVTATIEDVHVGSDPFPNSNVHWYVGLDLINATCSKLQRLNIQGGGLGGGFAGIRLGADSLDNPRGTSIANYIRDAQISGWARGIEYKDNSEGLHVSDSTIRDVRWGIMAGGAVTLHGAAMTFSSPGTVISHNQIYASEGGILVSMAGLAIGQNTITRIGTESFVGIDMDPGPTNVTGGNRLVANYINGGAESGTRYGIVVRNHSNDTLIDGNITQNMTRGIWLSGTTVVGSLVYANTNRAAGTTILDAGSSSLVTANH